MGQTTFMSNANLSKLTAERTEKAKQQIALLQQYISAVESNGADQSWGVSGDLGHLNELLQQAVNFLGLSK